MNCAALDGVQRDFLDICPEKPRFQDDAPVCDNKFRGPQADLLRDEHDDAYHQHAKENQRQPARQPAQSVKPAAIDHVLAIIEPFLDITCHGN